MRAGQNFTRFGVHLTLSRVHDETCLLQTLPLPARRDPPRGVAIFPLHAKPALHWGLLAQRGISRPTLRFFRVAAHRTWVAATAAA